MLIRQILQCGASGSTSFPCSLYNDNKYQSYKIIICIVANAYDGEVQPTT